MSARFEDEFVSGPSREIELRIFGFPSTRGSAILVSRPLSWRLLRTGIALTITAVVTPVVFLVPPHAPWGAGALLGGAILSRRRWQERITITDISASCPKCGESIRIRKACRMRQPHTVPCDSCHHEAVLEPLEGSPNVEERS